MTEPRKLGSLQEVLDFCEEVERTQSAADAMRAMCSVYADSPRTRELRALDPFSDDYHAVCMTLYREISGVPAYDPWVNERTPYVDLKRAVTSPTPYQYGDSLTVSDFVLSWGWIFRNLDVKAGASVLEYGAGEGQLSIQLARMGCQVAIVDIDERYLAAVRAQCESIGVTIELQKGQFGDAVGDRRFDRILFYEAFHHAFDHAGVLAKLKPLLAEGGFIIFSGEPVVEVGSVLVPFPWGPRLDGISVRSMRKFGWCELGFQRPYFVQLLMRSGYLVTHSPCPVTGRGDCYLARPMPLNERIDLGKPYALERHGKDSGWHEAEGTHRWTNGLATFTVPRSVGATSASLTLVNHLPMTRATTLRSGRHTSTVRLSPGKRAAVSVSLDPASDALCIETPASSLRSDSRSLGVAVEDIRLAG